MVYQKNCLARHGEGGKDGLNDWLVGGIGSLATDGPQKKVAIGHMQRHYKSWCAGKYCARCQEDCPTTTSMRQPPIFCISTKL